MPETRTFESGEDDDFARSVREQIGGTVRPNQPGMPTQPSPVLDAKPGLRPSTLPPRGGSALGAFTFTGIPRKAKPDADASP